ncbi:MAG: hypothetical protein LBS90_05655, partial [Oscillospiraceae bacterium]|nr:hypothetical protein [Oscillospiraceae bacterium]
MIFLISLGLAAAFAAASRKALKKRPYVFYAAAVLISAASGAFTFSGAPDWARLYVVPVFQRGAFATALFAVVMYAGALKNGSRLIKLLMPVRGELSIFAAILVFGHNIAYGKTYFRYLFASPERLDTQTLAAAVISLALLCLLIPLTVTSFPRVRKKMKARTWKKLQRTAYAYYALVYVHVMLLTVPAARAGRSGYALTVLAYSVVFLGYAAMRIRKALRKRPFAVMFSPYAGAAFALAAVCTVAFPAASAAEPGIEPTPLAAVAADTGTRRYNDGTYTGSGEGYNGSVTVSVTIENDAVTELAVAGHSDDKAYFGDAWDAIYPAVLE